MRVNEFRARWILLVTGLVGLLLVFVFQGVDCLSLVGASAISQKNPNVAFIVNRTIRLILNDSFCLLLIAILFQRKEFLRLAWWVFLAELFLILPAYLWIKLSLEGPSEISSPLLQPIHRMIVNPLLMIILIVAFYYQQGQQKPTS